jgi:hypothetical protein
MAGVKNLGKLLNSISPELIEGEYVFCTVPNGKYCDYQDLSPLASFIEAEGLTLVVPRESADKSGLEYDGVFRCITLTVHSSLEAVGLTAAVSTKLSEHQISANVIAAYFHDHVFVSSRFAEKALTLLSEFCS